MPALGFGAVAGGSVSADSSSAPVGVLVNSYSEEAVIYEFSYTTGTGDYALAGGWSTHLPLSARYPGGATGITYYVKDGSTGAGSQFEVGVGDYDAVGKTLSRLEVLASSSNNQLVDWSGRTRLLVRPLVQSLPLCSTPPTDGQVLEWSAAENAYCPATLPPPFPLCVTPPMDGQVLIWSAAENAYCPMDFCALVAACVITPTFGVDIPFKTIPSGEALRTPLISTLPATSTTFLVAFWAKQTQQNELYHLDIPFVDIGAGGLSFEIEEFALGGPVNVQIGAFDSGSNNIFSYGPTSTIPISQINDGNWHSFAWSCDTSTNTLQFAVDRVVFDLSVAAGPWNGNPISWFPASDSWALFALAYSLGLYDLWFNAGDPFFDLTSPVNLSKLFAPGNHPVDWGAIGGNITGSQPAVFLHGDAATFANNVGSGGPWTFGRPSLVTTITGPS